MEDRCSYKQIFIYTWWLILLCSTLPSFSQTVITGKVTDKGNKGLPEISVMLMLPADSAIVDYCFTDEKGNYRLSYNGNNPHRLITISTFDIKRQIIPNNSFEHYYNSAIQGNKNFFLSDAGLTYVRNGVYYWLDRTNIFNIAKYISTLYGALNSYYSEYDISPMTVILKVRFK